MDASDGVHNPVAISCICIEREKHLILRGPEVQCLAFSNVLLALKCRSFATTMRTPVGLAMVRLNQGRLRCP